MAPAKSSLTRPTRGTHWVRRWPVSDPSLRAPESGVHGPSHSNGGSCPRTGVLMPGHVRGLRVRHEARRGRSHVPCPGSSGDRRGRRQHTCSRRIFLTGAGLLQGPPLVGRSGSCWSRRVLLRCGASARGEGRGAGRACRSSERLVPRQHSPKVKRAWPRREPRPMLQRGLTGRAVLLAGPSSQQKRRRKPTWKLGGGSCSQPRARPRRTALFRLPRGCSRPRSTWSPSWRSGQPSQAVAPSRQRRGTRQ